MSAVSVVCSCFVGVVLFGTGAMKALSPTPFYLHLDRLELMPYKRLRYVVGGSALAQCLLGWGLILRLYPSVVMPAAVASLVAFAALTAWSWLERGAKDCGCYGGLFSVSSPTSLLLDAVYVAMVLFAWWQSVDFGWNAEVERSLFGGAGLVFASVIVMSTWVFRNWGQDMLVLTPVRVNKPWQGEWIEGYGELPEAQDRLVVLLSSSCSSCQEWTVPLNKMHRRDDMPQVVVGMAGDAPTRERFVAEYGIEFPLLAVSESTMDRIVRAFPTVIEVKGGVIASRAEAALPSHLVDRLRNSRQLTDVAQQIFARRRPPAGSLVNSQDG